MFHNQIGGETPSHGRKRNRSVLLFVKSLDLFLEGGRDPLSYDQNIGSSFALALGAGGAQAAAYDLTLIGDATDSTTVSVPYPDNRIDEITTIPLSLATGGALPTVSNNDTVDVTANIINGPVAVAASNAYNVISVGFFAYVHGTTTYIGSSSTTGTLSASLLGTTTFPLSPSGETTVEQIISNGAVSYPPDNAFSIDQVLSKMVINDNGAGGQPADLISAYLEIDRVNGVPEPATWMMLAIGFAALAGSARKAARAV